MNKNNTTPASAKRGSNVQTTSTRLPHAAAYGIAHTTWQTTKVWSNRKIDCQGAAQPQG